MSIPVTELSPGERVTLFCPGARFKPRREAVFEAVLSRDELLATIRAVRGDAFYIRDAAQRFAVFLTQTIDRSAHPEAVFRYADGSAAAIPGSEPLIQLRQVLELTDAGRLRDDEGRAVYIEARVAMRVG